MPSNVYSCAGDDGHRVAVAGASGYAGGEVLRLLPATRRSRSARSPRTPTRGSRSARCSRTWCRSPTWCSRRPPGEVLAGHDVVFLGLPHGQSAVIAEALPADTVGDRLRRRLPAHRRVRLGHVLRRRRTPASWPYGLPELRRPAGPARRSPPGSRSPAATRPSRRWRWPRPSPPGSWTPPASSSVAASGTSGAGKAPKTNLLGVGGDGLGQRVRRRRHPPAHPGDHPEPAAAHRRRRARLVHPAARADAPRHPRDLLGADAPSARTRPTRRTSEAYADEPFIHLLPQGQWPATKSVRRLQRRARAGHRRRAGRPAGRGRRGRQPRQGHRRGRRPVHEPGPRPAGDHRPDHDRT